MGIPRVLVVLVHANLTVFSPQAAIGVNAPSAAFVSDDVQTKMRELENKHRVFNPRAGYIKVRAVMLICVLAAPSPPPHTHPRTHRVELRWWSGSRRRAKRTCWAS